MEPENLCSLEFSGKKWSFSFNFSLSFVCRTYVPSNAIEWKLCWLECNNFLNADIEFFPSLHLIAPVDISQCNIIYINMFWISRHFIYLPVLKVTSAHLLPVMLTSFWIYNILTFFMCNVCPWLGNQQSLFFMYIQFFNLYRSV